MPRLVALDVPGGPGFVDELQRIWDSGDAAFRTLVTGSS